MCTLSVGNICGTQTLHKNIGIMVSLKIKTGEKMKKLVFTALVGLAMVAFTGCTTGNDAEAGAKCKMAKKCQVGAKCASSGKCMAKKVAAKCSASGKCASK